MEEDIKTLSQYKKIKLTSLLRTFKREGLANFVIVRRQNLENLITGYRELEVENQAYNEGKIFTDEQIKVIKKNTIPKSKIKEILDRLHISDIEPWSIYKVEGQILFDLQELMEDK